MVGGIGLDFLLAKENSYTTHYGYTVDFVEPQKKLAFVLNTGGGLKVLFAKGMGLLIDFRYIVMFDSAHHIHNLNGMLGLYLVL